MKKRLFIIINLGFQLLFISQPIFAPQTRTMVDTPRPNQWVHYTLVGYNNLDPASNYELAGGTVNEQVLERLVGYDGDNGGGVDDIVPQLATSWTVSVDGLVYIFNLRQGVSFQDGSPFNAWIMKYSLDRMHIMNDQFGPAFLSLEWVKGGQNYYDLGGNPNATDAYDFLNLNSTKVLDDYTISITLDQPFAGYLAVLGYSVAAAVSPSWVISKRPNTYVADDTDDAMGMLDLSKWFKDLSDWTKLGLPANHNHTISGVIPGSTRDTPQEHTAFLTDTMGTGPYKMKVNATNTQFILEKNTNWWNGANFHPNAVDEIIIVGSDSYSDRHSNYYDGNADSIPFISSDDFELVFNEEGVIQIVDGEVLPYEAEKFQTAVQLQYSNRGFFFNLNESLPNTVVAESYDSRYAFNASGFDCRWSGVVEGTTDGCRFRTLKKYGEYNNLSNTEFANPDNPFTSLLFRKAFTLSVDYEKGINSAYRGLAYPMSGVIPLGMFGHNDSLIEDGVLPSYNPVVAKALFEEIGWKGAIQMSYGQGNSARRAIVTTLKNTIEAFDIGIYLNVFEMQWPAFLTASDNGLLPLYLVSWGADYPDPHSAVQSFFHSTKGSFVKIHHYKNPKLDEMIDVAAVETDPTIRKVMYSNIEIAAASDIALIQIADNFNVKSARTWVEGIEGSGALNPAHSAPFQWAYVGKALTWDDTPIPFTYPSTSPTIDSVALTSIYTSLSDTIKSTEKFSGDFPGNDFILEFIQGYFSFLVMGGIGSVAGVVMAIILRRIQK